LKVNYIIHLFMNTNKNNMSKMVGAT
jgi:hypothetical protein